MTAAKESLPLGTFTPLTMFVLPGLHGGVEQLDQFCGSAPPQFAPQPMPLPNDSARYDALVEWFLPKIADHSACGVIGESFSGPLAVRLAAAAPERVKLLVVVTSFARSPRPLLVRFLPWRWLSRAPLPLWAMRRFMTGMHMSVQRVAALRRSIRACPPRTFAGRFAEIARTDVRNQLHGLPMPGLYLQAVNDWMVPSSCVHDFTARSSSWKVTRVEGGHMLLEANPAGCWQAIAEFAEATSEGRCR